MAAWITINQKSRKALPRLSAIREALTTEEDDVQVGQPDKRPLQLHVWSELDRVRTELEELSNVPTSMLLEATIVALEFGISQLETTLEVIAYWLAENFDGVIKSDNHAWFDHDAHRWDPFT